MLFARLISSMPKRAPSICGWIPTERKKEKGNKKHFHGSSAAHISLFIPVCNVYTSTNLLCQPNRNVCSVCGTVCWCTGVWMVSSFLKAQTKGRTLFTKLTVIQLLETLIHWSLDTTSLSLLLCLSVHTHGNTKKLIQIYWQQLFCSVLSERKESLSFSEWQDEPLMEAMQSCRGHWRTQTLRKITDCRLWKHTG